MLLVSFSYHFRFDFFYLISLNFIFFSGDPSNCDNVREEKLESGAHFCLKNISSCQEIWKGPSKFAKK